VTASAFEPTPRESCLSVPCLPPCSSLSAFRAKLFRFTHFRKNAPANPLDSHTFKTKDLKPFRFTHFQKKSGGWVPLSKIQPQTDHPTRMVVPSERSESRDLPSYLCSSLTPLASRLTIGGSLTPLSSTLTRPSRKSIKTRDFNPIRCHTYEVPSRKPCRINTYKKGGASDFCEGRPGQPERCQRVPIPSGGGEGATEFRISTFEFRPTRSSASLARVTNHESTSHQSRVTF
jgi:hypothetical protein